MQIRLAALFPALAAVAVLGMARADDAKKDDKADAKKDAGCGDGCCKEGDKDGAAKKDATGCCDGDKKTTLCAECDKAKDGVCDGCKEKLTSGEAYAFGVKGMMCGGCEATLGDKIKAIDGVAGAMASHDKGMAVLLLAPGKTVKLSTIVAALKDSKFSIDETAAICGRITLHVNGTESNAARKSVCAAVSKLVAQAHADGAKDPATSCCCMISAVDEEAKTGTFTFTLKPKSGVTIKAIRDAIAALDFTVSDIELTFPK